MNFLLGWIILSYLLTQGVPTPTGIAVEEIQPNSPAQSVGLQLNDQLLEINGKKLTSTYELIQASKENAGSAVKLIFKRNGKEKTVSITPRENPPAGQGALGIVIRQLVETKKYAWYEAPFYGLKQAVSMINQIASEILKIPVQLLTKQKTNVEFSGPVGIASVVDQARKFGLNALLELTALLSLNLAVFNILPFPALDGGRLVFILYEWVTGKRSNQKLEKYMNLAGIIILLSLSALVTINDIRKLWG
jgi:regulator of sigma E protease